MILLFQCCFWEDFFIHCLGVCFSGKFFLALRQSLLLFALQNLFLRLRDDNDRLCLSSAAPATASTQTWGDSADYRLRLRSAFIAEYHRSL